MKIDIQSIHFDADTKLIQFINEKMHKLRTFYQGHLDLKVFLRIHPSVEKQNKLVELKLMVNGQVLFVEHHDRTFESAIDVALDNMVAQLKKFKEKLKG